MTGKMKITKKQLKEPDEFITLTERGFLFVSQHAKPVAIGVGVVIVVILAFFALRWWDKNNEVRAAQKFNSMIEVYQKAMNPTQEGSSAESKSALEKIDELIRQFPRTSWGKAAYLYRGNIHLRLGDYQEAIKDYDSLLDKSGIQKVYYSFATEGLGYAYEGKKEYEKALESFKKTLEKGEAFQTAETTLNIARLYERLGKTSEALENYQAYLKTAPGSPKTSFVLRRISSIEK